MTHPRHASPSAVEKACAEDERFRFVGNTTRVGYYRNFERCLELVPPGVRFVALSDQDDVWHADKLETLLGALHSERVQLAYADMAIVSSDGESLAPSYWTDRANNYTDLASLLLINTVTGAASLFRRELLDVALPFPDVPGNAFHDHWLACIALALGDDRVHRSPAPRLRTARRQRRRTTRAAPRRAPGRSRQRSPPIRSQPASTRREYRPVGTTRLRGRGRGARGICSCSPRAPERSRLDPEAASAIDRVADMSSSTRSLLWLVGRSARDVHGDSPTLGIENQLIKGILWHRLHRGQAPMANRR